jgi:hypothetical protein
MERLFKVGCKFNIADHFSQKGKIMGARKTIEEQLSDIRRRREEKIKQMQLKDRAKEKKLNERLAKIKTERLSAAGAELAKLYKDQAAFLDIKKVLALCEKYWPAQKESKEAKAPTAAATATMR